MALKLHPDTFLFHQLWSGVCYIAEEDLGRLHISWLLLGPEATTCVRPELWMSLKSLNSLKLTQYFRFFKISDIKTYFYLPWEIGWIGVYRLPATSITFTLCLLSTTDSTINFVIIWYRTFVLAKCNASQGNGKYHRNLQYFCHFNDWRALDSWMNYT